MTDVFPRIRTVATGERTKALQGVVPVSVMWMTLHPGKTAQATDYYSAPCDGALRRMASAM